MSLRPGDWYQNPISVARRVSAALGMQGRAVYDALCSYVDNDSGETPAEPERVADEFQMSIRNAQRIIRELRAIRAIVLITRGVDAFYRVNREHPEAVIDVGLRQRQICHPTTNLSLNAPGVATNLSSDDKSVARNKEELDLNTNTKPTSKGDSLVLHKSPPVVSSDFSSDLDFAAAELQQVLCMFGSDAHPLCRAAIAAYTKRHKIPPIRAQDCIAALYARFRELGGRKEAVFFLKNGTFMQPESDWGLDGKRSNDPRLATLRAFGLD